MLWPEKALQRCKKSDPTELSWTQLGNVKGTETKDPRVFSVIYLVKRSSFCFVLILVRNVLTKKALLNSTRLLERLQGWVGL